MAKNQVEIREIVGGWIVDDSYRQEEYFFKTFIEAKDKATLLFQEWQDELNE